MTTTARPQLGLDVSAAAALPAAEVTAALGTPEHGLTDAEVELRRQQVGVNAVRTHEARWPEVLLRQLRSPLLLLLAATAVASAFLGERSDALIIAAITTTSVGLGFVNEYRAERAAEALHAQVRNVCLVTRDGHSARVDVVDLVPGDLVRLQPGEVVPADIRLVTASGLECEESVLTGESLPVEKSSEPVPPGTPVAGLSSCALMGTVVHTGSAVGVVVATGARTEFGRIAMGLGERQPDTAFQVGLRRFSLLLVHVAGTLTAAIFVINVLLHRPVIDAMLFSLAIAVGISPQLLPAIVSTSLAAGSRRLARDKVLVKRLICIEDLGDIEVLFTDKTGTLTEGRIGFVHALRTGPSSEDEAVVAGLVCSEAVVEGGEAVGGNPLDVALWEAADPSARAEAGRYRVVGALPFDHERRRMSVLVDDTGGSRQLLVKGAPEGLLDLCTEVPAEARSALETEFGAGNRVVAVARRPADGLTAVTAADESGLSLVGLLVFLDPPKPTAAAALQRLDGLGITVKVVTGDNATVAARVCGDLGLAVTGVVEGAQLDGLDDDALTELIKHSTVFARVSPEQKARIVRAERRTGVDVAFLGDGVNDALALHAADVGISVDAATDVAKAAADVVLLEKDLDVLADGVLGGRRIFANTVKYVLMGTSSNFGNMFSAAAASMFLSFLPMLPSQILLNNLLYDVSQLALPTDRVDPERLARPSRWDVAFIRRFMLFFGPISSLFDFATFGVMLWVFHADAALFRTGWFVESLATQSLVVFAIRTRRVPFFRSRPSRPVLVTAMAAVAVGALLPVSPVSHRLGFRTPPATFFLALLVMIVLYLALIETGKRWFFRTPTPHHRHRARIEGHRIHRRAARFSAGGSPRGA